MIWFLQRGTDVLVCEARQEDDGHFELAVLEPDGSERVERLEAPTALVERLVECQSELRRAGWRVRPDGHHAPVW